jgi:hypothetical protein
MDALPLFENTFYTNDVEYVEKTETMLNDVWRNAQAPSAVTAASVMNPAAPKDDLLADKTRYEEYRKGGNIVSLKPGAITEKDIINKIVAAQKMSHSKVFSKHIDRYYGSTAIAVINPPDYFNLPRMIIHVHHFDKPSSFGAEDGLAIHSWLKTPKGFAYVPVAFISDNPRTVAHRKQLYAGTPAAHNSRVVGKEELQVRVHGNTLFAGWTVPIPLFPPPSTLPPCCLVFEGYGELRTSVMETRFFNRRQVSESNGYEAFVTFYHPSSKYSGPGTDGLFARDAIITTYPRSAE